jgi:hypothetical protein
MFFRRLNFKEIRNSFFKFLMSFIVLLFFSFLSFYLFYKSSEFQQDRLYSDVLNYKQLLNKQIVIKSKVDTIFYNMSLLNTGKVRNDLFLESYIAKDVNELKKIIGEDNDGDFKHYSILLRDIDSILTLKNKLIYISDEEKVFLRDLNECMNKFKSAHKELSDDPLRKFNKK